MKKILKRWVTLAKEEEKAIIKTLFIIFFIGMGAAIAIDVNMRLNQVCSAQISD